MQSAAVGTAALQDGFCDHAAGQLRGDKGLYAHGSRALSKDRDVVTVAAECSDIFVDPFQCGDLIQDAVISGDAAFIFSTQPGMRKESEDVAAVFHADQDHAPVAVCLSVKFQLAGKAAQECAAVDPECDRELFLPGALCRFRGNRFLFMSS